jgi:hypothetical protein
MRKPRKKRTGRPLEDVSLKKLVQSVRRDIERKLEEIGPSEGLLDERKPQKKSNLSS